MQGKILWTHRAYEAWGHIRDVAFCGAGLTVGENSYPQGALCLPHCSSGNLHILDPRSGDAAIERSLVKQYVLEQRMQPLRAPLVRLDFGPESGAVEEGWQAVGLEKYDEKRGFGWESLEGVTVMSANGSALQRDGHAFAGEGPARKGHRRAFLIRVPEGCRWCVVRVLVGGERACPDVEIYSGLSYGKPKRVATVSTGPRECKVVEFAPKPQGMLDVTFGNTEGTENPRWAVRGIEVLVTVDRLDAHAGKIMAAFTYAGRIQQVSPPDWKVLSETIVPDLRDVAVLSDGRVLALSGDAVVLVDEGGTAHEPLIEGLTEPMCLSVDRATGDLFVTEWGESHQVKRFSRDYGLLGTYGRPGGRLEGLYRGEDLKHVADIAGDGRGGFFVVEHWVAPRRLAHFDRDGRLLREWYGGQRFFTNVSLDARHPDRVWLDSHFGWIMEADVDWDKGRWRPRATYGFAGLADDLIQVSGGNDHWLLRYHGGERYLVHTQCPRVLRVEEEKRRLQPVVAGAINVAGSMGLEALLGSEAKGKWRSYLWTDGNGDGRPQRQEVVLSEWGVHGLRFFVDEDFTYYAVYAPRTTGEVPTHYVVRVLAPTWHDDVPVYPLFEDAEEFGLAADESFRQQTGQFAGRLAEPKSLYRDGEGNCYLILHGAGDCFTAQGAGTMGHGFRWPADLVDGTALAKWDRQGRLLWKVGLHASERASHLPGRLNWPTKILGRAHGCIGVADRIALPLEMWTEDGLYAGGLFDRRADDGLPDTCYAWWRVRHDIDDFEEARALENTAALQYDMNVGGALTEYGHGEMLFLGAGWNNLPTYRVSGWKRFVRLEGSISVAQPARGAAGEGTGLWGEYFAGPDLAGQPALRHVDEQIWFGTEGKKQLEKPWPDHPVTTTQFSARWTGWLEPRFTETYRFSVYLGQGAAAEKARLWVGGTLVLDAWDAGAGDGRKRRSSLVALQAGRKVPIKLEYAKTASGELHLCWESVSEEIEHIPSAYLYPARPRNDGWLSRTRLEASSCSS
jgi:hypothetical protein